MELSGQAINERQSGVGQALPDQGGAYIYKKSIESFREKCWCVRVRAAG